MKKHKPKTSKVFLFSFILLSNIKIDSKVMQLFLKLRYYRSKIIFNLYVYIAPNHNNSDMKTKMATVVMV